MLDRAPQYIAGKKVEDLEDGVYGELDEVMAADGPNTWTQMVAERLLRDENILRHLVQVNWQLSSSSPIYHEERMPQSDDIDREDW